MSKSKIMPSIVLGTICLVVALLLALVNMLTEDRILENSIAATNQAYADVLEDGVTVSGDVALTDELPKIIEAIKSTSDGGYAVKVRTKGYKPDFVVICGVSGDGKITGTKYTESSETNGAEAQLVDKYQDATLDTLEEVVIAGSTKTSDAYHEAVKASLQAYTILKGGSVDLRDPAEILKDNCNTALGTENIDFDKWIGATLDLGATVYVAKSGDGIVIEIGKTYIAYGKDGTMKDTEASDADKSTAGSVYAVYSSAASVDVTEALAAYKNASTSKKYVPNICGAWKLSDGSYVLTLEAKGYGVNGSGEGAEYIKSGKPIYIEIHVDKDGKIISCVTTEQNESAGKGGLLGTECGSSDYYSQFDGKTQEELDSIGVITGATFTTDGYKGAVKCAVEIVKTLVGGDEQ